MSRTIDLIVANPAGNTTVFVLTPTPINDYKRISARILEIDFGKEFGVHFKEAQSESVFAEQVAFILPQDKNACEIPAMNMCGLEFCGNASRTFAYYRGTVCGDGIVQDDGSIELKVNVSGCDHPLSAKVCEADNIAKIQMPVPSGIISFTGEELGLFDENPALETCFMIDMDGISHLVLPNIEADPEKFERLRRYVYDKCGDFDAFGVMFYDDTSQFITPVVYVRDVNTTYFEGSCASGSTATAFSMVLDKADGPYDFSFKQPAGILSLTIIKENDKVSSITLSGLVELSDQITINI